MCQILIDAQTEIRKTNRKRHNEKLKENFAATCERVQQNKSQKKGFYVGGKATYNS